MNATQKSESPGGAGQFATNESTNACILTQVQPSDKQYATAQAQLAMKGHTLTRSIGSDDGRVTWHVGRWNHSRSFGHWGDVLAFIMQIGGAS